MLYKDLTPEQQELLDEIILQYGEIPDDATHIDDETSLVCDTMLKFVGGVEFFFIPEEKRWKMAGAGLKASSYFQIPEDFCRKTGKVIDNKPEETTFPDFPFKLSCGDRPEVRQWLKDNGCKWIGTFNTDLTTVMLDCKFLYVRDIGVVSYNTNKEDWNAIYEDWSVVEPTIKVIGYTLTESSKARKQKLDKIVELRNNIKELQKQIVELEEELGGY